jgi:hypothetical protein
MAQIELAQQLMKKYRAEVLAAQGVTSSQAEEIVEEGYAKGWRTGEQPLGEVETSLD